MCSAQPVGRVESYFFFFFPSSNRSTPIFRSAGKLTEFRQTVFSRVQDLDLRAKNHSLHLWFETMESPRLAESRRFAITEAVTSTRRARPPRSPLRPTRTPVVFYVTRANFTRAKASNTAACLDSPLPSFEGSAPRGRTRVSPSRPTAARCPPTRISRCASARTTPTP